MSNASGRTGDNSGQQQVHSHRGSAPGAKHPRGWPPWVRLRKHADFDRVYRQGRRQFSANFTVFYLPRFSSLEGEDVGPRIGFTVGRALGAAVERNRMKRRLREAARANLNMLDFPVDIVINPKKPVLTMEFSALRSELERAFREIAQKLRTVVVLPRGNQQP